MAEDSYPPTDEMVDEAQRGLDWRREFGRGGTEVGIARARDIVNRKDLPIDTWRRIKAYFDRHEIDKQGKGWAPGEDGYPSNGRIAWALWGGDAGWRRATSIIEDVTDDDERSIMQDNIDEIEVQAEPAAAIRYSAIEIENRRIGGRDVEFRTVEVDGLQLRAVEADTEMPMRFAGYAAVFNSPSEPLPFIETIAPGAFRRSLKSDSEKRMFLNHNTDQVLASTRSATLSLSEDDRGLYVEAELPDTTYGRDLSILMQRGDVHSMSFGFSVPRGGDSWSEDGTSRELREVILHEVSVVTGFPAYPATEGAQVRSTEEIAEPITEAEDGLPVDLARRMLELNAKR
jgi:HK97 family phage prohead protease